MPFPLSHHLAVAVDNIIYVLGGYSYRSKNTAMAAYDPLTDSWEIKASMPYTNVPPSACVINGKIYVVKSNSSYSPPQNFLEYDPKTNKWTDKAPTPGHMFGGDTETCVGGYDGRAYLANHRAIHEYDPSRNAWSQVESAGGAASVMIGPKIFAISPVFKSIELGELDWMTLPQPPVRMDRPAVTATNSRLYLAGGMKDLKSLRTVLEYDLASNRWTAKSPLNYSVRGHAMAAVDGTLYVFGGEVIWGRLRNVEAYTPAADDGPNLVERKLEKRYVYSPKWQPAAPMPTPRSALSVANACPSWISTIGGQIGGKVVPNVETYYPIDGLWQVQPPLKAARRFAGATCLNKFVYVAGGQDNEHDLKSVEVYDFTRGLTSPGPGDQWTTRAPLSSPRSKLGLIAANGKVYAIGGERNGKLTDIVEAYDPSTNRWAKLPPIPVPIAPKDAVTANGRTINVYAEETSPYCFKRVYSYDTVERTWTTSGVMPRPYCLMGWTEATELPRRRYDFQMGSYPESMFAFGGRDERGELAQVDELILHTISGPYDYWAAPKDPEPPAQPPAVARKIRNPHDFAVVVGIDGYRSLPPARGGERDAASIARHLQDALGLPAENVIVLTKERASRADFASVIEEWIPKNASSDSRVFFYFAGHGTIDPVDRSAYLLPWDADLAFLRSSAYSLTGFFHHMEALKARQVIVFLDCCFGSDADRCRESRGLRPLVAYKDAEPHPASKITVYFAASNRESAGVDQDAKGGLFTGALIEGLTGPVAERKSGTLTAEDLFLYIQNKVDGAAKNQGRKQTPRLFTSNRDLRIY